MKFMVIGSVGSGTTDMLKILEHNGVKGVSVRTPESLSDESVDELMSDLSLNVIWMFKPEPDQILHDVASHGRKSKIAPVLRLCVMEARHCSDLHMEIRTKYEERVFTFPYWNLSEDTIDDTLMSLSSWMEINDKLSPISVGITEEELDPFNNINTVYKGFYRDKKNLSERIEETV